MKNISFEEAISLVNHEIYKKQREIELLKDCIKYLDNEKLSNDELTQTPKQILENFGYKFN